MAKSTAQRIRENQDAHAHCYYLVWRNVDGSLLTDENGSIAIGYFAHNSGQVKFAAKSRGFTGYQIIHTIGTKTLIKKGVVIFDDTQDTERESVNWWAD